MNIELTLAETDRVLDAKRQDEVEGWQTFGSPILPHIPNNLRRMMYTIARERRVDVDDPSFVPTLVMHARPEGRQRPIVYLTTERSDTTRVDVEPTPEALDRNAKRQGVDCERDSIRLDWFEQVHRQEFTVPPYYDDADDKWHVYQGEDELPLEFVDLRDAIDAAQGAGNEPVPSVSREELLEIIRGYRHGIQGEEAAGWIDRVDAALK